MAPTPPFFFEAADGVHSGDMSNVLVLDRWKSRCSKMWYNIEDLPVIESLKRLISLDWR